MLFQENNLSKLKKKFIFISYIYYNKIDYLQQKHNKKS